MLEYIHMSIYMYMYMSLHVYLYTCICLDVSELIYVEIYI